MILLLAVIYITFISLGLPDSLFGAAWPVMHGDLNVSESFASIYMIVTAVCSGGISFYAGPLIRKFGTGAVTIVSVALTAIGILIVSFAPHIAVAILGSIVMGFGAGAIDTGLNNYVSTHYKASHMSWLHCFWGLGVTVSPLILSAFLGKDNNWREGYQAVACIQFGITFLLLLSIPLWRKYDKRGEEQLPSALVPEMPEQGVEGDVLEDKQAVTDIAPKKQPAFIRALKTRGVLWAILSLGFYTGMEFMLGTWGASYMVNEKGFDAATAALWISLYYGGIMTGRFISGFLSYKLNDKNLIRLGECVALIGMILFALPIGTGALVGLLIIGIGFGPVFPSTIHATSERFGRELSADITGIQMGGGYAIGWATQLTFGFVAPATTFAFMPYLLLALAATLLFVTETLNKLLKKNPDRRGL